MTFSTANKLGSAAVDLCCSYKAAVREEGCSEMFTYAAPFNACCKGGTATGPFCEPTSTGLLLLGPKWLKGNAL